MRSKILFVLLLLTSVTGAGEATVPLEKVFSPDTQGFAFIIPPMPTVQGLRSNAAQDCGVCHSTIHNDWANSTHAQATRDLQFLAELAKKDSPEWLCLNCHLPLQEQRRHIVTGLTGGDIFKPVLKKNPTFNEKMHREGITCATCHIRVNKKTGQSFIIGPGGNRQAPHPVKLDKNHLHNMCARCHDPKGEAITPNLVCWFTTHKENAGIKNADSLQTGCVACHMPETAKPRRGPPRPGMPVQKISRHFWSGGGIPKIPELIRFMGEFGYKSGLEIKVGKIDGKNKGRLKVPVVLHNKYAGHDVPTGDPERFINVTVSLLDGKDMTVQSSVERIGQVWEWDPAKKISDNRIKAGEKRKVNINIKFKNKQGIEKVRIKVISVKLTSQNAKYMSKSKLTRPDLMEKSAEKVKEFGKYYPMARILFQEDRKVTGAVIKTWSSAGLDSLSASEMDIPLSKREY